MAEWRLAKSLVKLRSQVNALAPGRSVRDDGTIGDTKHSSRKSDHNPNRKGVVRAFDVTHDPAGGLDSYKLAETLRINRDPRIVNVISAGKIFSSEVLPWQWRKYVGANAHRQHVHVGVRDVERLYDDGSAWVLAGGPSKTAPTETTPPTLWKGAKGQDVVDLQRRLGIEADGDFGRQTELSVRAFQRSHGLTVDGVVGVNTWLALLAEPVVLKPLPPGKLIPKQFGIVATVFGGKADEERSAYDNKFLGDDEFYVSLPFRFKKPPWVKVTNTKNGKSEKAPDRDVGPWNVDDDYWNRNVRPQAESGRCVNGPNKGRKTNLAGIDLSPALAKKLGLTGDPRTDRVDWEEVVP